MIKRLIFTFSLRNWVDVNQYVQIDWLAVDAVLMRSIKPTVQLRKLTSTPALC